MQSFREKTKSGLLLGAFLASLVSLTAQAQAPAPWLDVAVVQIKGGMALDFENRVKELQAARKAAGMPMMQVFNVVSGHPNEYHPVTPVQSLVQANSGPQPMAPPRLFDLARANYGDDVANYYHSVPVANWATFDAGDPVAQSLGQRRMDQLIDSPDGVVESSELIVARIR